MCAAAFGQLLPQNIYSCKPFRKERAYADARNQRTDTRRQFGELQAVNEAPSTVNETAWSMGTVFDLRT